MLHFKKADTSQIPEIWKILQDAIARRKADGSNQWQDGYPNPEVIKNDIEKGVGYVLMLDEEVAGYAAVLINDEPEYDNLRGSWLTQSDFVVFHRVAVSAAYLGQGLAQKMMHFIEEVAKEHQIYSIKADTNFDNLAMMRLFDKMGYVYCGEVYFRGSPRKAYEKVLAAP